MLTRCTPTAYEVHSPLTYRSRKLLVDNGLPGLALDHRVAPVWPGSNGPHRPTTGHVTCSTPWTYRPARPARSNPLVCNVLRGGAIPRAFVFSFYNNNRLHLSVVARVYDQTINRIVLTMIDTMIDALCTLSPVYAVADRVGGTP